MSRKGRANRLPHKERGTPEDLIYLEAILGIQQEYDAMSKEEKDQWWIEHFGSTMEEWIEKRRRL
jgi:hypothetical protein